MNALLQRGLVWAPAAKAALLFILPAPLLLGMLKAMLEPDLTRLAYATGGLVLLWTSGAMVMRALIAEAHYLLGERPDPPAVPLKQLSAAITALGVALAALAGPYEAAGALMLAALGGLGHLAFYGRDLKRPRIRVAVVDGVDGAAVTQQLKLAYGRLRGIESAAREIGVPEFRERLARITGIGRSVLQEIERDPADATRARRFLNLYLDSAERVTVDYARTHRQTRSQPLEQNFRQLLADMESTFADQHRKLVENDVMSLDVDIEVLNARLKREGLG